MPLIMTDLALDTYTEIVYGLRSERRAAGRMQAEVAAGARVSGSTLSCWELGTQEPRTRHLIQWARVLHHRLVILGADGEPLEPRRRSNEPLKAYEQRRLAAPLAERRLLLELDEDDLAARVGVSAGTVRRWERVRIRPYPIAHIIWAQAIGCSLALQPITSTIAGTGPAENRGTSEQTKMTPR